MAADGVRWLHWLLGRWMRGIEERMIRRLLRQRDEERDEVDKYRRAMGMKLGEFLPVTVHPPEED